MITYLSFKDKHREKETEQVREYKRNESVGKERKREQMNTM